MGELSLPTYNAAGLGHHSVISGSGEMPAVFHVPSVDITFVGFFPSPLQQQQTATTRTPPPMMHRVITVVVRGCNEANEL